MVGHPLMGEKYRVETDEIEGDLVFPDHALEALGQIVVEHYREDEMEPFKRSIMDTDEFRDRVEGQKYDPVIR